MTTANTTAATPHATATNAPYTPSRGLDGGAISHWEIAQEGDGEYTIATYGDGSVWHSGYRAHGTWHDSYWS